jgi:hypothetical protein
MNSLPGAPDLGGANLVALNRAIESGVASLPIGDSSSVEQYCNHWVPWLVSVAEHVRVTKQQLTAPITLIHSREARVEGERLGWKRTPFFGSKHVDVLNGSLCLVPSSIGGYLAPPAGNSLDAAENLIRASNLQKRPTLILTTSLEIYLWPDGIDGNEEPIKRSTSAQGKIINTDAIKYELDQFYKLIGRFGGSQKTWWRKASRRITCEGRELAVQRELHVYLVCAFAEIARVEAEVPVDNGRADIVIRPYGLPNGSSGVIELKTIRSVRTPKDKDKDDKGKLTPITDEENEAWACAGVQQAAAYRDSNKLGIALLCIYDFRVTDDNAIDKPVATAASTYNVVPLRYWVTASHEEHRKIQYPLPQTA